ncbi:MAG: hypothetical protein D6815_00285 [Candidatus Dadabacteria bacterium]|nr:MAG: hypothetical protein D6815_00285 [Candidatus Dadabacteria bacterium]
MRAVREETPLDGGIEHGAALVAFTDAVMRGDEDAAASERSRLLSLVGAGGFIDVAATIAAFNVVDRIANATGIPLDPMLAEMGRDLRQDLALDRFPSAANTP